MPAIDVLEKVAMGVTSAVAGGTFSIALLNAIDRGVAIKMVADKGTSRPGFQFSQFVLRRDLAESGAVRQPADLRGRKVGVASLQAGPEAITNQVLQGSGLTVNDVDMTVMSYPDMLPAFRCAYVANRPFPRSSTTTLPVASSASTTAGGTSDKGVPSAAPSLTRTTVPSATA